MVHFTSTIAIIASAVGLVAAQSYQDFTIDATVLATFAGPVFGQSVVPGSIATGKAACDTVDDCIGVICSEFRFECLLISRTPTHTGASCYSPDSVANNCALFAYDATNGIANPGTTGYDSVHYR
jgi:hypothetical protein